MKFSLKFWVRYWLGLDVDLQRYRQELAIHRAATDANVRQVMIDFLNQLGAQTEAELRDKFAMAALQARLTLQDGRTRDEIVEDAYGDADAMLFRKAGKRVP